MRFGQPHWKFFHSKGTMDLHPDFRDLLVAFAESEVNYLLIGGYAVGFYARPRLTKDIDLWIGEDRHNLERTCQAFSVFGAPQPWIMQLQQAKPDEIVWLGKAPLRVDILQRIPGVQFGSAWERRVQSHWGDVPIQVIAKEDLIAAKQAAGRKQDLLDIEALRSALDTDKMDEE